MWWQPPDGDHERQHHSRCPDDGAAPLLPSSPRVAAQCTSALPIDRSDGRELLSCESEGWDRHLWVNGAYLFHCASTCGKGEPSEQKRSGAGAAGVQVRCSITRLHYPCSDTTPCTLLLPHVVSSLMILRDRGDVSDSQQGIKLMPPSTSATLMVVLTTHPSEGSVRDVDGERHGDVTVPPRGHATASCTSDKVPNLFAYPTYVREWYSADVNTLHYKGGSTSYNRRFGRRFGRRFDHG